MATNPLPAPTPSAPDGQATAEVQRLFLKNMGAIKGFILALLRNRDLAEDVLQETFLVVTAKAGSFQANTNFVAWACTIARFKVLEAIRKSAREPHTLSPEVIEALATDLPEESDRETRLRHLENCITQLSASSRNILQLRYFHTLAPEEIGRRLNMQTASVYVLLSRVRRALRRCLEHKVGHQTT